MRPQLLALTLLTTSSAGAQALLPGFVTDTAGDTIWSCADLDMDGTYNGTGEINAFYDDSIGAVALTNNTGLIRDAVTGALFVSDTSEDFILRLQDLNGDGDAHDLDEATIWFDGTSAGPSGIELTSGRGMWRDDDGVIWVASANTGGGGNDAIVRLEDVNGDGDANDPGESREYYVVAPGASSGDSIPTAVSRGADGAIYYVETASSGSLAKGVYRLEDLNGSGDIDQPGEITPFFLPPDLGGSPFHWDLGQDTQGNFYINDTGNDVIWRFADTDGNGTVTGAEATVIYTAPGSSLIWEATPAADGTIYVAEDQNPDRLLRLVDSNGDGVFDLPGEVETIYDETVAVTNFGSPKAVVLVESDPNIGVSECGPAVINSTGTPAMITATGSVSLAANSVTLTASSLPPGQFGIFAVSRNPGSFSLPSSQGLLCLSGVIGRYNTILNSGASGAFEFSVDVNVIPQAAGFVAASAGETWRFQGWFRDANPTPTSNLTDVIAITFQ